MSTTGKTPRLKAPPLACDTHMHVYEKGYTILPGSVPPPDAPATAYRAMQDRLGITRAVVVQPNAYGKDNTCTLEAIAALGPERTRGIAVIDEEDHDGELERLTEAGIRGVRFHLLPKGFLSWAQLAPLSARVQEFGWHTQVQLNGRELPEHAAALRAVPGTVVVDHVGRFHDPVTPDHPAFRALLGLLDTGRFYVKLSAPYESQSRVGPPRWDDVGILARALAAHAPERMLWASNWPHPGQSFIPDEADLPDLLADWAPDEKVQRLILVENPARLYF